MLSYNFGTHESLKIYHWFRHLSFRRTSQLIVTFIRPFINLPFGYLLLQWLWFAKPFTITGSQMVFHFSRSIWCKIEVVSS